MSEERKQILNLLAAGKISVADAERLLHAVSANAVAEPGATANAATSACCAEGVGCCDDSVGCCDDSVGAVGSRGATTGSTTGTTSHSAGTGNRSAGDRVSVDSPRRTPKYLCVRVDGDDKVNVRVPIALLRAGLKLGALLPKEAQGPVEERLAANGIKFDFTSKNFDELLSHLNDLDINVTDKSGDHVRVCCE